MNRSAGTIALIVVAVIIALVLIVYAAASYTGGVDERAPRDATSSITIGSSTSFLVDPRYKLTKPEPTTGGQGTTGSNTTPPAPAPSRGGLFGSFFSRITGSNTLPAGYTQTDLSPYYQKVTISGVRRARSSRTSAEQPSWVTLKADAGDVPVVVTGWQVKTNRSGFTMPRGVRVYHTTASPLENIELRKGEVANIYTSSSPLNANFIVNKCSGYLGKSYPFSPPLPNSCPRPKKGEIETFTGVCQEYILRLRTCDTGNPNDSRVPSNDPSCRSFVSTLNYEGCVQRYQKDLDFFRKEWKVWSGSNFLDPLHDRVLLLDSNGKLVDSYSY